MSQPLSSEQKNSVAQWLADGASISEIQKRLSSEFTVSITYMDLRFLIDDLGITPVDKTPPDADDADATGDDDDSLDPNDPHNTASDDGLAADPNDPNTHHGSGKVSIEMDAVQRPGELVSGSVTFSDGQTGQWYLDNYGQLGFEPPYKGYQPAARDLQQFQVLLRSELAKNGYAN